MRRVRQVPPPGSRNQPVPSAIPAYLLEGITKNVFPWRSKREYAGSRYLPNYVTEISMAKFVCFQMALAEFRAMLCCFQLTSGAAWRSASSRHRRRTQTSSFDWSIVFFNCVTQRSKSLQSSLGWLLAFFISTSAITFMSYTLIHI